MSSPARTLREEHHAAGRARLTAAALRLLARPGAELTMRSVAQEAGTSERTIYRYFPNLEALQGELGGLLADRMSAPFPESVEGLPGYIAELFGRFEADPALARGLVAWLAAQPRPSPDRVRHLAAWRAVLDAGFPGAAPEDRAAVAASLRVLVSGDGWAHLRFGCGLPPEQVLDAAHRSLGLLLAGLAHGRARPSA